MTKDGKKSGTDSPKAKAASPIAKSGTRPKSVSGRRVGELLPDIGRASFRRFGFVQSSIISRWAEIVGDRYARISAPESIRFPQGERSNGVMTLVIEPAHAAMIQHILPDIIDRTNRFFGYAAVIKITLKQDRIALSRPERKSPPSLKPVPAFLGDSLKTIADPELRATLEALASAVVASQGTPLFDDPPIIGQRSTSEATGDSPPTNRK